MFLDAIPAGPNLPYEVNVVVEVPIGGDPIKYELNEEAGVLFVDRFLYTSMHYPGNYGFIPHMKIAFRSPLAEIREKFRKNRIFDNPSILRATSLT
jgi:hypothetical protein